jgi:hypothetical protein
MKWLYNCRNDNHQNPIPHKPVLMDDCEWLKQKDLNNHLILQWTFFFVGVKYGLFLANSSYRSVVKIPNIN